MGHYRQPDSGRHDPGDPEREDDYAGEPAVSAVCAPVGGFLSHPGGDSVCKAAGPRGRVEGQAGD